MTKSASLLNGSTAAVLGFNARPLACSATRAGARVIASDYWGDEDLETCSSKWANVLTPTPGKRQRRTLERPVHESLIHNMIEVTEGEKIDYLFVGSGFDDHTDSLTILEKRFPITGNSSKLMKKARDRKKLTRMADRLGLEYPASLSGKTVDEAISLCEELRFPCIIRPPSSGGGSGITLVTDSSQVKQACWRLEAELDSEVIVQKYISGIDGSCSVLSTGIEARALSIQGQLIGMPSAGRNCDFVYSGNFLPLTLPKNVKMKIEDSCVSICTEIGLIGSNGVDFLVDKNETVWLMEVNPRFQGSLELLELNGRIGSKKVSLTVLHTEACTGMLPKVKASFKPSVKIVVFSRRNGRVPKLSNFRTAVDRSPEGVMVNRGDPICTILESGRSLQVSYQKALAVSRRIQQAISSEPSG